MTVLLNDARGKPMVEKTDAGYTVYGKPYDGPEKLLLEAIAEVKVAPYPEDRAYNDRDLYYKAMFNFCYSEGNRHIADGPDKVWEHVLARKGKLLCPKCNTKMVMYYVPTCVVCEGVKSEDGVWNWLKMQYFIELKYDQSLRDCAAKKYGVERSTYYNVEHRMNWERKHYPIVVEWEKDPVDGKRFNAEGMAKFYTVFNDALYKHYREAEDGEKAEIPYWDYWDLVIEVYDNIRNDTIIRMDFAHLLESCEEDWQREITELFIKEFGAGSKKVEFSW